MTPARRVRPGPADLRHAGGRQADRLAARSLDRRPRRPRAHRRPCAPTSPRRAQGSAPPDPPRPRRPRRRPGTPAAPRRPRPHGGDEVRRERKADDGRRPARPARRRRRCRSHRRRAAVGRARPRAAHRRGGRALPRSAASWKARNASGSRATCQASGSAALDQAWFAGGGPDRTGRASCRRGGRPCRGSRGRGESASAAHTVLLPVPAPPSTNRRLRVRTQAGRRPTRAAASSTGNGPALNGGSAAARSPASPRRPLDERRAPRRRASSRRAGRWRSRRRRAAPSGRPRTGRTRRTRRRRPVAPASPWNWRALSTAPRQASTRLTWPEPRPTSIPSRTSRIAFETTPRHETPGEVQVAQLGIGGPARRRARPGGRIVGEGVGRGDEDAAARGAEGAERVGGARRPSAVPQRGVHDQAQVGLGRQHLQRAPRRTPARPRPRGRSRRAARPARRSTVPVTATTPPNAETGSPASAASQASSRVGRSAAPHGLVCLQMTIGRAAHQPGEGGGGRGVQHVVVARAPCPGAAAPRSRTGRRRHAARGPSGGSARPAGGGSRRSGGCPPSPSRS